MKALRIWSIRVLPWITGVWVLVELLSLRLGLLKWFFFDAMHANVQGIDYFSVPKAFLNLSDGVSAFATSDPPAYGPRVTWFAFHPAVAVWLGSWLSLFAPMTSYWIYTCFAIVLMAVSAWLLARESGDPLHRRLVWLLVMGAFPTYWLWFVGNIDALTVLALTLLFVGVYRTTYGLQGNALLLGGLVLNLLSKPIVLLMMPLLLLLKETRRTALRSLSIYAAVSIAFEIVPALNPQSIGLRKVFWLTFHPAFVRAHMNFYKNGFKINNLMRDNSVHWFNMIAQSGFAMVHVDIYSLPAFLFVWTSGNIPGWVCKLPLIMVLLLALLVSRIAERQMRLQAALLLLMATSLILFVSYPVVWEYQYTGVLPVAAMLLLVGERGVFYRKTRWWMFGLAACAWLPSLYVFVHGIPLTSHVLLLIWADRVLPVTALCLLMIGVLARKVCFPNARTAPERPASDSLESATMSS